MTLCRWLALASVAALANGKSVQLADLQLSPNASIHQQAVVGLFVTSYEAYRTYAWGHDDLLPVSKSFQDQNGLGASISDALGTMWLMGFCDWFEEAVDYVATVDFSLSQTDTVSLFETTIHHVGGLLSAYELSGYRYDILVDKAEEVTQQMAYALTGDNSIPYRFMAFTNHTPVNSSIAEAGTLTLEWNRLSNNTGNDTYRQLAEGSVQYMIHMPVLPGMPALSIDPSTGNSMKSWGSGCDSYYEYLIKYPRLTNADHNSYADAWLTAVDTSIKVLMENSTVGNWVYLADYDEQVLHVGSHLACFYGGNWILGGKLTNNDTIVNIGLQLTDVCEHYLFAYTSSDGNYTGVDSPTAEQIQFYNEHGYYILSSEYTLRPEVLESNFYAWRVTGDTKYLDRAASAIESFQTYFPTTVAYSGIDDVNNATSSKIDNMESFWLGEVLKYLYLMFDDPNKISLDDYVFNTEGHPFKAPTAKSVYGSAA